MWTDCPIGAGYPEVVSLALADGSKYIDFGLNLKENIGDIYEKAKYIYIYIYIYTYIYIYIYYCLKMP